ncbi:unnamed protein product [Vicia faba]|uniref:Nucleolar protein 16 n=1 Tax=Vicia faba TaxID=3906 RepID=A0AAV0YLP0_VICFA|nr:unnamed protein product [Vicia faba]
MRRMFSSPVLDFKKYKNSRPKVRVGLPKKNPKVLKPAFTIPPKLLQSLVEDPKWDEKGSVTQNYNSFGVFNDPNSLTDSLRAPPSVSDDPNDSGRSEAMFAGLGHFSKKSIKVL